MSRRIYLLLILVRLYFALSPSYIHPDEHFQGPEIITGQIFGWPSYMTWEFTSERPIRSIFPLWLVYGPPLTVLKWTCDGFGYAATPLVVFYTLRVLMFLLSFVLEDWALHELMQNKRERATALLLVASSHVTWTFQMHTLSNSIETIVVLWCIVLMRRMMNDREHTQVRLCVALAFLGVLGIFNRITFPAFLIVPAVQLLPHLRNKPFRVPIMLVAGGATAVLAIAMDTDSYSTGSRLRLRQLYGAAVVAPINNLVYNLDSANLAEHGLHPFWQHFVANLPQLIGPAYPLLFTSSRKDTLFWSGLVGIAILSCFKHQEPRFLLPAVPLLLSTIKLPTRFARLWIYGWMASNLLAAVVFGFYHQAGVVSVQGWIAQQEDVSQVLWWKTYSPPRWLLGARSTAIETRDLMGMSGERMIEEVVAAARCRRSANSTLLVAPGSATFLDGYTMPGTTVHGIAIGIEEVYEHRQHIGLDDLDWGEDGLWPTLERVIGRRGLKVWQVSKQC